jgi:hypothetical protein
VCPSHVTDVDQLSIRCPGRLAIRIASPAAAPRTATDISRDCQYQVVVFVLVRNRMLVSLRGGGGELGNLKP